MKNKDNPVPSIVKDLNHVCAWYQGRDVDACKRVEAFAKSLENGVETNKEQPKCKCEFDLNVCKNTCSNLGHSLDIKWS